MRRGGRVKTIQKARELRLLVFAHVSQLIITNFLIVSCTGEVGSNKQVEIEYLKKEITISDKFVNNYTLINFAEIAGSPWLIGYNRLDHSLEYLDLKHHQHKKIKIEEIGPNSIEYPISFMGANGANSIIIKNPPTRIYKVGHQNGQIDQVTLDYLPNYLINEYRFQYQGLTFGNYSVTEYTDDNILTKILFPVSANVDPTFFDKFSVLRLNTEAPEKFKIFKIAFPNNLEKRNVIDLNLPEPCSFEKAILISIPGISNIIELDHEGVQKEITLAVPKGIDGVISMPLDPKNYRKRSQLLFQSPRFFPLQFDAHRDLFYRIYRHKTNSRGEQKKSLLIYNQDFELIGHSDLPLDAGFKIHIGNEDIFLTIDPNYQDAENFFQLYQIKIHNYEKNNN